MAVGNNGAVKAPSTYITWGESAVTVSVGGTATITFSPAYSVTADVLDEALDGIASSSVGDGVVTFRGLSAGTTTLPVDTLVGISVYTTNSLTVTVVASVDDQNFLNERGLAHFWGNIDTLKQDKLTAGTNITISANNTISASQPTVGNATLTIQKNGTNVQTFTANATSNKTANITVPTKTSELTNDSNFVADASYVHTDNNYTTTEKNKLAGIAAGAEVNVQSNWTQTNSSADDYIKNKPTIPTVNNATLTIQKNGTTVKTFTANASSNVTANITVPTTVAELSDSSNYATTTDLAAKQNLLSPGNHISISSDVISATGYVHSENPQAAAAASSTITGSMIANGTITADKLASDATVKLTMSTSDIGEGAPLAANTLYGVYR